MNNSFYLKTKYIAMNIIFYEEIDSTQKETWRRIAKDNIRDGDLIIARRQTSGIGTHGRTWYTDGCNITLSLALFPAKNIENFQNFTYEIAKEERYNEFINMGEFLNLA